MELDEQNQQESDYDNELDEDDGHYKEAIPPAPKLQGTIPRTDANSTQTANTKNGATATGDALNSDSVQNHKSFSEGKLQQHSVRMRFFSACLWGNVSKWMIMMIMIQTALENTHNSSGTILIELMQNWMDKLEKNDFSCGFRHFSWYNFDGRDM